MYEISTFLSVNYSTCPLIRALCLIMILNKGRQQKQRMKRTRVRKKQREKFHEKKGGRRRRGETSALRSYNDELIIIMMRWVVESYVELSHKQRWWLCAVAIFKLLNNSLFPFHCGWKTRCDSHAFFLSPFSSYRLIHTTRWRRRRRSAQRSRKNVFIHHWNHQSSSSCPF